MDLQKDLDANERRGEGFVPPVLISPNENNKKIQYVHMHVPDLTGGWLSRLWVVVNWIRCTLIAPQ